GERPEPGVCDEPSLRLDNAETAELRARGSGQTLAAADRLPHLPELLRREPRTTGLPAADERRTHQLEEMLLLASGQAARDPLPQVPPFRAPLDRTRVTQVGGQHAPET